MIVNWIGNGARLRSDMEPLLARPARAVATMPPAYLLDAVASVRVAGIKARLGDRACVLVARRSRKAGCFNSSEIPDLVDRVIDAMIGRGRPLTREARTTFGSDRVLRRLLGRSDDRTIDDGIRSAWFSAVASDTDAVARVLIEDWINDVETLEVIARVVAPDALPNAYGNDPWLVAVKRKGPQKLDRDSSETRLNSRNPPFLTQELKLQALQARTHLWRNQYTARQG